MKNRSSSEIVAAILSACQGGAHMSRILHEAAIGHGQARAYLSELLLAGFLTLDAGESTIYTTTPEGLQYLRHQRVLLDLLA